MRRVLFWVGIVWAVIGLGNIVLMYGETQSSNIQTFGLIFNFVLFIFPGLVLVGLGRGGAGESAPPAKAVAATAGAPTSEKECPYCKSMIAANAVKCRFCGEWVVPEAERTPTA